MVDIERNAMAATKAINPGDASNTIGQTTVQTTPIDHHHNFRLMNGA